MQETISKPLLISSTVSLTMRVAGVLLGYFAHVLLARLLGLQAYGEYIVLLGWALVLTLPTRLGMDNSALRFSAVYLDSGHHGALRAFVRVGAWSILATAVVVAITMVLVGRAVGAGNSVGTLLWSAALIPPLALLGFFSALLRAARRIFASQFYDQVLRPAVLILFILAVMIGGKRLDPTAAMMLTALAALVALAAILVEYRRSFQFLSHSKADLTECRSWYGVAIPLLVISVVQELLNQMEVLLLGYLADARMAGLFSAAWRLASLMPFALQALAMIGAPMIAAAYHRADRQQMCQVAKLTARWGLSFAVAAAVLLVSAGHWLLGLFGHEFREAYPALVILVLGGAANAFTGIVAYFLTLTGRERVALWIFLGALAVSLGLNLLLIPRLGVVGGAIASASALCVWNFAMLVYVRRDIGIDASAIGLKPKTTATA